jgi:hypothetical protein
MKKSLMVLASFLLGISAGGFRSAAAIVLPKGTITLNWNYPALTTNITFNVYHTTDLR